MLLYCFNISADPKSGLFFCDVCVERLEASCIFKNQVEEAQFRLSRCPGIEDQPSNQNLNDAAAEDEKDFETSSLGGHFHDSGDEYESQNRKKAIVKKRNRIRKRTGDGKIRCPVCKVCLDSAKQYRLHMQTHRADYVCTICGKSFKRCNSFRAHELTHSDKVHCEVCGKPVSLNTIRTHRRLHDGYLIYACRICPERFNSHLPRDKHRAEVHGVPMKVFRCERCPAEFNCASARKKHSRRVHNCERNFSCPECGMAFFDQAQLRLHGISHSGEKNVECKICHKKFGRSKTMRQHMKTHETKPPPPPHDEPSAWNPSWGQ